MDGNSLQTESNFVGAAIIGGSKVIKGISNAKKQYDSKLIQKPLPDSPKPPTPQKDNTIIIIAIAAAVILILIVKK